MIRLAFCRLNEPIIAGQIEFAFAPMGELPRFTTVATGIMTYEPPKGTAPEYAAQQGAMELIKAGMVYSEELDKYYNGPG